MYIPYEKLGAVLTILYPQYKNKLQEFFMEKKVLHNCKYIEKNSEKVLKRLQKKVADGEKVRVAFICSESTKWKCDTVYDFFNKDDRFEPFIVVNWCRNNDQSTKSFHDTCRFFESKYPTILGYDEKTGQHIHAKDINADLIFYQQPWANPTCHGPVVASKYALTYYVPYFVATSESFIEYGLRFHQYVHKHYVLNQNIKKHFSKKMKNKGKNLVVAGHPILDYFLLNEHNKEEKYVIYAPHHSFNDKLSWGTFLWNGQFILDWAKKHSEFNWIFKPHPVLSHALKEYMSEEEIKNYWGEWAKIGLVCDKGEYLSLFNEAKAMITDCGSFLTEFFMTQKPLIRLISDKACEFNENINKIAKSCYNVCNLDELEQALNLVLLENDDEKKELRKKILEDLALANTYAGKNIYEDIKKELKIHE